MGMGMKLQGSGEWGVLLGNLLESERIHRWGDLLYCITPHIHVGTSWVAAQTTAA